MLPGKSLSPAVILGAIVRRRWIVFGSVFFCAFAALLVARAQPELYQADTLIQIVPQRIPDNYVRPTVTTEIEDRLKAIHQQILSRTTLEQIINDLNLYPKERKTASIESLVGRMRGNIDVQVLFGGLPRPRYMRQPPDSFRVAFSYDEPEVAKKATERLARMFVDENAEARGNQAQGTSAFLQSQLADARRRLTEQEARLERFRQQNAGRLPTQVQTNIQAVQTTNLQLQSLVESMATDRNRKLVVERLVSDLAVDDQALRNSPPPTPNTTNPETTVMTARQRLAAAESDLVRLQQRLKPEHPDIVRLQRTIVDLKAKVAAEGDEPGKTSPTAPVLTPDELGRRERMRSMRAELDQLTRQIAFKESEERQLRSRLAEYQGRLDSVPAIESEFIALTRDYDTLQETYKSLLAKSEESRMAADLERRQVGEQFKTIDAPRVSPHPMNASRIRINLVGFALGLLLGIGIAVLLELFDSSFRSESDVAGAIGLPVLALVPAMPTRADLAAARKRLMAFYGGVAAVMLAALAMFWRLELWRSIF
jgi:polysaccharide chain length determinant protein (PEP-CTERM system associated)